MNATYNTITTAAADGVFTITLNRPDSLNAFNDEMGVELGTALRMAARDDDVRCIVLTGAGRAFCSGQDLAEIKSRYADQSGAAHAGAAHPAGAHGGGGHSVGVHAGTGHAGAAGGPGSRASAGSAGAGAQAGLDFGAHLRQKYNPIIVRLRTVEKPVVAAVNGVAAGAGASFAFACDLRICARSASFVMAFVHVGLVPDSGATLTLFQHVGYGRAAELCFLGEKLTAEEAQRIGLANRVVDDDKLADATREVAMRLASLPTRAIGLTKRALQRAWQAELEDQLEYEAYLQATAGGTADHREGVTAFLEKRKPRFIGG